MKPVTLSVAFLAGVIQCCLADVFDDKERCFEELGCFPVTSDFYHPVWRPINVAVDPRESIKTTFLFHTRENKDEPDSLIGYDVHDDALDRVHFDPTLPTKFVVHGFLDTQFFGEWMAELKTELLNVGDFNVIIVDWMGGNSLPYTQSTANTRLVGAEVAVLVEKLQAKFNISLESVHMYGHSLGAHIIGYAGARLGGKVDRLTGLDTAEPYFQNMPPSVRLDPSDGQFVEAIHSDAKRFVPYLAFGFHDPVGHLDFYPNGGEEMPNCGLKDRLADFQLDGLKGVAKLAACNHLMAIFYATNMLTPKNGCVPVAFECEDYEMFQNGHCYDCGADGSKCAPMTYNSMRYFRQFANASRPTKMYFNTAAKPDYCIFHYNVQLKMRRFQRSKPTKLASPVSGDYYLKVEGTLNSTEFLVTPKESKLHPGSTSTVLATTPFDLGEIRNVSFRYVASSWFLPKAMELESVKVTPMNIAVPRVSLKPLVRTFCPADYLKSRKNYPLTEENCNNMV